MSVQLLFFFKYLVLQKNNNNETNALQMDFYLLLILCRPFPDHRDEERGQKSTMGVKLGPKIL